MAGRMAWLNGWEPYRQGPSVLMGTGVHCVGCGRFLGVTCVSFEGLPDGFRLPEKEPDWPFEEEGCPVCLIYFREVKINEVEAPASVMAAYRLGLKHGAVAAARPAGGGT